MRLWKRAAGALKDRNSIWIASLSRRTSFRNPDLEAVIIKATSHDESYVDYKNSQRVFQWVRTSPIYLKPLVWGLSMRMQKTRSWAVALKGLMLMHGIFHCKTPAVQMIGRLPFDLSNFIDGHSHIGETWGYNVFIRAYYLFLDQKSVFSATEMKIQKGRGISQAEETLAEDLTWLQKLQSLLDMLLQVKPQADNMIATLIIEAMECLIVEIFDVYSRICSGIAQALLRIYEDGGKAEASMALKVLQKARVQGEELSVYFEFCRDIGVLNASEFPKVEKIPEEDVRDLERIINGVSKRRNLETNDLLPEDRAIVVRENGAIVQRRVLKTVITETWEAFDEEILKFNGGRNSDDVKKTSSTEHPSKTSSLNTLPPESASNRMIIPDLISL